MTVLAFALLSSGPPLRLAAQRNAPSLIRMGQWLPEDMTAKGLPLPSEVESKLSDDTSRELTEKMWAALRGCYDTEAEAISAAERSMSTVLPYLNRPSNIVGSYRVLCDKLGADGAREKVTPAMVDALAARGSMPLCMTQIHGALKSEHKHKHWSRLQFGLFLQGAGLSMEDHVAFLQAEFTKIMSAEQFTKNYAYSVRHMHGREGKRTDYTPYSCMKIIMGNPPGAGEFHGCPYRHNSEAQLVARLGKLRLEKGDADASTIRETL